MAKNTTVVAAGTEDTHDFCLDENGQIMMLSGLDAYAQIVNCNMRTILGEKQLDKASGIPYLQTIFSDSNTVPIWVAEVQKMLESIPFVIRVRSINTNVEDGVLSYRSVIETDLGSLTYTGSVKAKDIHDKRLRRKEEKEEEIRAYILAFNTEDGDPISPAIYNEGDTVKLPTASKAGWNFIGWFSDPSFTKPVYTLTMPAENITLYAKFFDYSSYNIFTINPSYLGEDGLFSLRVWSKDVEDEDFAFAHNVESRDKNKFAKTNGFQFNSSDLINAEGDGITNNSRLYRLRILASSTDGWPESTNVVLILRDENNTKNESVIASKIIDSVSSDGYAEIKLDTARLIPDRIYHVKFFNKLNLEVQRSLSVIRKSITNVSDDTFVLGASGGEDWVANIFFVTQDSQLTIDWGDGSDLEYVDAVALYGNRPVYGGSIVTHEFNKKVSSYSIKIGGNCALFKTGIDSTISGMEDMAQPSKDAIISIDQWGSNLISAFRTFTYCRNLTFAPNEWGGNIQSLDAVFQYSSINKIVETWPENVEDIRYAYESCALVTGRIPAIPRSVTECKYAFQNCPLIEPTLGWEDPDYDSKIMPNHVTSHAGYVGGTTNSEVRALYTSAWGGTKAEAQSLDLED